MLPGSRSLAFAAGDASNLVLRAAAKKPAAAAPAPVAAAPAPAASTEPEEDDAAYQCPLTGKRFKSKGAYESYVASKKYKALAAKAAAENKNKPALAAQTSAAAPSADDSAPRRKVCYMHPDGSTSTSVSAANDAPTIADGSGSSNGDSDEDEDDDAGWEDVEWEPRYNESLFDGHSSASFAANVGYMRSTHNFYVPEEAALIDAKGLFSYLQEKIYRRHTCIYCHRRFRTLEAVRTHMEAKSHCKLGFDCDESVAELAPFYNLHESWWARRAEVGTIDGLGELVLKGGRRLGHRSLLYAYRQKQQVADTRLSVLAARRSLHARRELHAAMHNPRHTARRAEELGSSSALAMAHGQIAMKVALRAEERKRHQLLTRSFALSGGTSKALAANYVHKADFADNKHTRALQHHGYGGFGGGAHFTMSGSRQFHKGNKVKGLVLRKVTAAKTKQGAAKAANSSKAKGS